MRRRIADFKHSITQINFYIVDACTERIVTKRKQEEEKKRKREGRWPLARRQNYIHLDVFAFVVSKSDTYIILVSPFASLNNLKKFITDI